MIPFQMLSAPLLNQLGIMYGIAVVPLTFVIFGVASMCCTSSYVMPIILARALYNGGCYAIYNTSRELLWLPLSTSERLSVKPWVNGNFRSFARICGSTISLLLAYFQTDPIVLAVIICAFGACFLIDCVFAKKAYVQAFYASLKRGHLDFSSPHVDILPSQQELVRAVLTDHKNERQIRLVLDAMPPSQLHLFRKEMRALFYNKSAGSASGADLLREETETAPLHTRVRILELALSAAVAAEASGGADQKYERQLEAEERLQRNKSGSRRYDSYDL